jgi:uncharacterized delta-60 repeat protein
MAKHLTACITISALLLVGATRAWAGPGDIDSNYGSGGRVAAGWRAVTLALPDDRLIVGEPYSSKRFRVRALNANGQPDTTFGNGGEVLVPLPATQPGFELRFAVALPNGGMLFAGLLSNSERNNVSEVVLRLDGAGHPDPSFGTQGDGFYRLPDPPIRTSSFNFQARLTAIAVDPVDRLLLAESCQPATVIRRLLADGSLDATFGTNGQVLLNVDSCGGIQLFGSRSDGSIIVGARGSIVGLDASGAIIAGFGVNGRISEGLPGDWRGRLLPDGGLLLLGDDGVPQVPNDISLYKFDSSGHPNATFGSGTGSVVVDLGTALLGEASANEQIEALVMDPSASYLYLQLRLCRSDGCLGGIVKLSGDGTPDATFGNRGLTILSSGTTFGFSLFATQTSGAPLFRGWLYSSLPPFCCRSDDAVYRLLPDATPSPGFLTVFGTSVKVDESARTASVTVARLAGRDGPLSVNYGTQNGIGIDNDGPVVWYAAHSGSDYETASGRLDWADGDDGQRTVTISILDDNLREPSEWFGVAVSDPSSSSWIEVSDAYVTIVDNDPQPVQQQPVQQTTTAGYKSSGGGGSISWIALLALLAVLTVRKLAAW